MSYLRIIAVDPPGKVAELSEADSDRAFDVAEQLHCTVLDVVRDDKYVFSLCRMHGDDGYWAIFQRQSETIERLGRLRRRASPGPVSEP